MPLIVGNLASAVCTAMTPLFHRFGRISAALWLTAVFFVSLTWFTRLLGRDSGVALNLIGTSAVAFAILGLDRLKLVAVISAVGAVLIIASWVLWPHAAPGIHDDAAFMQQTFASVIVSIMTITFVVVY